MSLRFKAMLFLFLWYELAGQLQLGADASCLLTAFLFGAAGFAKRLEVQGIARPVTTALLVRGVSWLIAFFWLAPDVFRALPATAVAFGVAGLALAGTQARREFEALGVARIKEILRDHSEAVVGMLIFATATGFLAMRHWGSLLPLAGYVSLIALPVSFGWTAAGRSRSSAITQASADTIRFAMRG
jgi:hypothetical protein